MIIESKKKITKNLIPSFEEAGSISLKLRKEGLKKEIKNDNTPVTNGDIQVNNLLTSIIKKNWQEEIKELIPDKSLNWKLAKVTNISKLNLLIRILSITN